MVAFISSVVSNVGSRLPVLNVETTNVIQQLFPILVPQVGNNPADKANFTLGLIQSLVILLFIGLVLFGIVFAALAGYKFIASRGAEKEITDAQGSIKYILIGLGVAFIGGIAVVLISNTFSSTSDSQLRKSLLCVFGDLNSCKSDIIK